MRLAPAFISVTTAADDITPNDGTVSLREAITAINAGNDLGDSDITAQMPGTFGVSDSINFNIPGPFPLLAPFQINVGSDASAPNIPLPAITKPVTINGWSQPGFVPTNYFFAPPNPISTPVIVLNGASAGPSANGLDIRTGGVTILGLDINSFNANGILLEANDGTQGGDTIIDNYIGCNPLGTRLLPNHQNGILIDGTNSNQTGLAASNNQIGGFDGEGNFISGNGQDGVLIQAHNGVATGNILSFNYIGVGNTYAVNRNNFLLILGSVPLPNAFDGVAIDGASGNQIGQDPNTTFGGGNTISGNGGDGVHVIGTLASPATGNNIVANHIGDDPLDSEIVAPFDLDGQVAGIELQGATGTNITGNTVGGNVMGIELDNGAQNNVIQGNAVGILSFNSGGPVQLSNDHGIELHSSANLAPPGGPGQPNEPPVANNLIGGTAPGQGNIISYNNVGVIVSGNPVSLSGQPNDGNAILGNAIFENSLIGISLSTSKWPSINLTQTPNDSVGHGGPHNPNNSQNFPVLTLATAAPGPGTRIQGSLTQSVSPNTTFRIEFFANDPVPPLVPSPPFAGADEGQFFLGFTNVTTDASGHASFDVTLPLKTVAGQLISATATDPNDNTSEFSTGLLLQGASGRTDPRSIHRSSASKAPSASSP
jgi:CSLREA domain-containing protein